MFEGDKKRTDSGVTPSVPEILPLVLSMECTATQVEMNTNVEQRIARGFKRVI